MTVNEEYAVRYAMDLIYVLNEIDNEVFVEKILDCINNNTMDILEQILLADEDFW